MYLTPEQIQFFDTQGYLVIEKFWDDATVDSLRTRIGTILDTLDLTDPRFVTAELLLFICVQLCNILFLVVGLSVPDSHRSPPLHLSSIFPQRWQYLHYQ